MPIEVIVADDHKLMRQGLRKVLSEDKDIEVVGESCNGRETVEMARLLMPDIVIMDVAMPDLNGIDATRRIVDLSERTRVLGLSAHSDERLVRNMLQAGASGYLLKECAASEVIQAIRKVNSGGRYISAEVMGVVVDDYVAKLGGQTVPKAPVLSGRERDVLQLISEGRSTADIAERLHVGVKTVETHRKRLMDKLKIRSVAGLTKYAIREGLTTIHE